MKIIIDCKGLNDKGICDVESVVRKALKDSELDIYVTIKRK